MTTSDFDRGSRMISGCGLSGMMSLTGERVDGRAIISSIALLHDRSNGLGGGFAAYGIYPEHPDHYALHLMYYTSEAQDRTEKILAESFDVALDERIPTRPHPGVVDPPALMRYFVLPRSSVLEESGKSAEDFMLDKVMEVNAGVDDAYVFSSGKNMGAFKAVGYAEDIGAFFRLEEYQAYIWIGHSRFPTNTTGWWGGAHPFGLLDWAVVHNGEISSYGINRRYLANFGYKCALQTDTEVITYLFDLLIRKHRLPLEAACMAMAPPFWYKIARMEPRKQRLARAIRTVYGGALLNGPFSVLVANSRGIVGFNDRIKLRPMVAARHGWPIGQGVGGR